MASTISVASGHKVQDIEGEEATKLQRDFKAYKDGLIRLTPGPWTFQKEFLKFADKYYRFKFHRDDVVIMTYPKCGTTWTQEIVWTMRNNPNFNHSNASSPILVRVPFLEFDIFTMDTPDTSTDTPYMQAFHKICQGRNPEDGVGLQLSECTPKPRTIKTHLPFSLLPPLLDTCKVVYVARNPKDVVVSYYHHSKLLNISGYVGTLQDFTQHFVDNNLLYGNYASHLKEAWEKRNHPNVHFIYFEDMKADIMTELQRLNTFLGTQLTSQQLDRVAQHTSFKEMKERDWMLLGMKKEEDPIMNQQCVKNNGGFFRKGEAGNWKNELTPQLSALVDTWTENNMKSLGMDFKYSN